MFFFFFFCSECDWPFQRDKFLEGNHHMQLVISFTGIDRPNVTADSLLKSANTHYHQTNLSFVLGESKRGLERETLVALEHINSSSYECHAAFHTRSDAKGQLRDCEGVEELARRNRLLLGNDLIVHIVDFADPGWLGYAYPPWWYDVDLRGHIFLAARAASANTLHGSTFSHELGHGKSSPDSMSP
jgi:hypothetical protein